MLSEVLSTPYFYFSTTLDLTNTRQREWEQQNEWGPPTTHQVFAFTFFLAQKFPNQSLVHTCIEAVIRGNDRSGIFIYMPGAKKSFFF
jgi:hypothetical protein